MQYSVWNPRSRTYSVYNAMAQPVRSLRRKSNGLGDVPGESMDALPPDAKYVAESEIAVGQIVCKTMGFGQFVMLVLTYCAARWIYEEIVNP